MRQIYTKSRRQRRKEAKEKGVPFQPRYADGLEPRKVERKQKEDE